MTDDVMENETLKVAQNARKQHEKQLDIDTKTITCNIM